jgi:hypothetical protein
MDFGVHVSNILLQDTHSEWHVKNILEPFFGELPAEEKS